MKQIFIFYLFMAFGFGCAHQQPLNQENPDLVLRAEAEEWRSSAPGVNELTEHGTDLTIELSDQFAGGQFMHIIYSNRKSFPVTVDTTENNTILVQARVIYTSDILAETSEQSNQTDRLVFQTDEGNIDFIPVLTWSKKPDSYR